jgi:hypothetical protein
MILIGRTSSLFATSYLTAKLGRVNDVFHNMSDRGNAITDETVPNNKPEFVIAGAGEAGSVFRDEFSECREVEGLGREELLDNFLFF